MTVTLKEEKSIQIMGLSIPVFMILSAICLGATYMNVLPSGMIGAFSLMMIIGAFLNEAGNRLPIIKDYLGGGAIVVIFASAALIHYGILPESAKQIMTDFMKGHGFLNFYIAALITGSILGMDRKLLIHASIRYLPVILGGVLLAIGFTALAGMIMGYGAKEAVLYVAIPIMGGGMGAGAVPLSQIFGEILQKDPAQMMSKMVPALALGNAMAIIIGGMLNRLGKKHHSWTGNGKLMKVQKNMEQEKQNKMEIDYKLIGIGIVLSTTFFVWGKVLSKFSPIHPYALMILSVAMVKVLGVLPKKYEEGAFQWFGLVMNNFTPALLVGIGVAYTDLQAVINSLSFMYVILVFTTVLGAAVGSAVIGNLLGFYPIEASVTGGLCMANMGGTGDVAVLSACDRMKLMPFAQISSRIGGAFMLILATSLVSLFL